MAEIAKSGNPSLASLLPPASQKDSGLICGEDIAVGDACYVKSDGSVWRSNGSATGPAADVEGFALSPAKAAQLDPVTLAADVVLNYGSGLTPGASYYISAVNPGGLADAPTTGGTKPCAKAIDGSRVRVRRVWN